MAQSQQLSFALIVSVSHGTPGVTTRLKTRAKWDGEKYIVNGEKIWTSTAQVSNKMLLIARTKDISETNKPIDGLSLFYTDLDRNYCDIRVIDKMGRKCVDSFTSLMRAMDRWRAQSVDSNFSELYHNTSQRTLSKFFYNM